MGRYGFCTLSGRFRSALKTESENRPCQSQGVFASHGASSRRGDGDGKFAEFRVVSLWRMSNINDLISHGERAATNMFRHVSESWRNT